MLYGIACQCACYNDQISHAYNTVPTHHDRQTLICTPALTLFKNALELLSFRRTATDQRQHIGMLNSSATQESCWSFTQRHRLPAAAAPLIGRRQTPRERCSSGAPTGPAASCELDAASGWMVDAKHLEQVDRFVGPVECVQIEGKGRGLRAARSIHAGELLLLVPPLAVLVGSPDQPPTPSQLVDHMLQPGDSGSGAPAAPCDSPWIGRLFDGSTASVKTAVDISQPGGGPGALPAATETEPTTEASPSSPSPSAAVAAPQGKGRHAKSFSTTPKQQVSRQPHSAKRERQALKKRVAKVVALNAFGDRHQDLSLAALAAADEPAAACVGVWPEFAMLNHSCAPNAINYPLHLSGRGLMVVRAARDIAAGDEVTISYVGADQLLPLRQRRRALKDAFAFECGCGRCAAEAAAYEGVGATLDAVVEVSEREGGLLLWWLPLAGGGVPHQNGGWGLSVQTLSCAIQKHDSRHNTT